MPVAESCASTAATWCSRASCGPRCLTGAAAAIASWQATIRSRRTRSKGCFAAISYASRILCLFPNRQCNDIRSVVLSMFHVCFAAVSSANRQDLQVPASILEHSWVIPSEFACLTNRTPSDPAASTPRDASPQPLRGQAGLQETIRMQVETSH